MSVSNVTSFPPPPPSQTQSQQQLSAQQPLQGGKVQGGHHHHGGGGHKGAGVAGAAQGTAPGTQTSNTDATSPLSVDTTA